jgi:hypothetical protein
LSVFALMCVALAATSAFAADHRDAPLIIGTVSENIREKRDINDLYVFRSPQNLNNVVFIITVNPFVGVHAEDGTLDPNTRYDLKIDTTGDFREDIVYTFYFSAPNTLDQQNYILQKGRSILARGRTGVAANVSGGGKVQVSVHDDPFFFDSRIVPGMPAFTGPPVDQFANANITALILEIPRRNIPVTNINVWTTTSASGRQVDRTAIPGLNTVLTPDGRNGLDDRRDEFNVAEPVNDEADFTGGVPNEPPGFVDVILEDFGSLMNVDETHAQNVADALLPDVLNFTTTNSAGFLNGRRLEDDVIDAALNLITNGNLTTDGIDENDENSGDFLTTFPYVLPPQMIP